ncbi:hypothetical protein [Primorskyibacter marinus]|uniref:hypothetical protein n=1 Tax=Primorskyibacter marinus TaxID=1977320 RepID=UPI000E303B5D|nr:hypothetical protein [Primorskyibacter marinus]
MTQIQELERRIVAALDRIGQGVVALDAAQTAEPAAATAHDPEDMARLQDALENERQANAKLEDRVRAIHEKQQGEVHALRAELESKRAAAEQIDRDLQRLRKANDLLRDSNDALRRALEDGVADTGLIDTAMLAELEGLRATRAAETAENRAVLAALEPLLIDAANNVNGDNDANVTPEGGV